MMLDPSRVEGRIKKKPPPLVVVVHWYYPIFKRGPL